MWNLLVSFSLLSLPKVPNFGEFQNEFENQYLIVQVTTDFGFQNNYFLLVSESDGKKNWKPAWLWMIFQSRLDTGWKFHYQLMNQGSKITLKIVKIRKFREKSIFLVIFGPNSSEQKWVIRLFRFFVVFKSCWTVNLIWWIQQKIQ